MLIINNNNVLLQIAVSRNKMLSF